MRFDLERLKKYKTTEFALNNKKNFRCKNKRAKLRNG